VVRAGTLAAVVGDTLPVVPRADGRFALGALPVTLAFSGPASAGLAPGGADRAQSFVATVPDEPPDAYVRVAPGATADAATRGALVGRWYSAELDATWTVAADRAGRLTLAIPHGTPGRLEVLTRDALRGRGVVLRLERGADDRVRAFTVNSGRAKGMRFERSAS